MRAKNDQNFQADAELLLHAWQDDQLAQGDMSACVGAHLLARHAGFMLDESEYPDSTLCTWIDHHGQPRRDLIFNWYFQLTKWRSEDKKANLPKELDNSYTLAEIDILERAFELSRVTWTSATHQPMPDTRDALASCFEALANLHRATNPVRAHVKSLLAALPDPDENF